MMRWMIFIMVWLQCLQLYARQYQTFEENGKVGMKDDEGHVVIPPSFEALGWSDGNFSVAGQVTGYRLKGLWGLINLKKEFVTKAEFENLVYSGGENVVARKKINSIFYKTGCLNLQGQSTIAFQYDGIVAQGLRAIVFNLSKSGYRYGLVDNSNKSILPLMYKYIRPLGSLRYAVENEAGKIALFNEDGTAVTNFVIDSVSSFYKGYAIVYQGHLQGLIDREGTSKLEIKYQSIKISEDGKIFAQLPSEWSFVNEQNETIQRFFTDEFLMLEEKLFCVRQGSQWGVMNDEFKWMIPAQYESIVDIGKGRFLAKAHTKVGAVDRENKILIPFSFDSLLLSGNVFISFTTGRGWQIINESGRTLSERFYKNIHPLGNFFLAQSKGFYGLVNENGQEFVHCVFDSIQAPIGNLIAVKFKGKFGIINLNEDWVVAPQDFPLSVINQEVYLQKQPGNQFVKTLTGETKYFTPYPLRFNRENFTETLPNGIEKTISYDGLIIDRITPPENTEEVFRESEGFRGIRKDGRYGFVDVNGKLRIANRYDSVSEFHEELAAVKLIGRWGFVNTSDHVVVNPNYDRTANFKNGVAVVSRNKKFGVIDKAGNVILPLRYDHVLRQASSFLLTSDNLKGLADFKGNVTIEPRFDRLISASEKLMIACRDDKCGVITTHGLNVIPMTYDQLIFDRKKNIFIAEKKSEWKAIDLLQH